MNPIELYRSNKAEFFQFARYLAVGGWNTLFGIGIYAALYYLFGKKVNYLLLSIPANILSITNAFLCYKFIVFRTSGNFWREYFKCYVVYGAGALIGMAGLWVLVKFFRMNPVAANILLTGITVIVSYIGHKYFSFRKKRN